MTVAEVISKEALTTERLLEIYKHAYMDAQIDSDGDVALTIDGFKLFAKVEPEPKFMTAIRCGFSLKPEATREQVLELCNRINDRLILIRASYPEAAPAPMLWLDHYTDTEAGLTAEEVVDLTRRFVTVFASIPPLDTDSIMK
ncbi:MAG TPA: YbjN domain-containing protein [Gaiellaceae bacterium]|nr:YbjN domain-containing protein [Gaiellaceae bacterium]